MGFLSRTVSIAQFTVEGDLPPDPLSSFIADGLSRLPFRPIDTTLDEETQGWVTVHDHTRSDFSLPADYWYDGRVLFSLRRDQRKIPSALMRYYLTAAEREFLTSHPGLRRVPKRKRDELKDAVKLALLSKTLPSPSVVDIFWNTRTRRLSIASLSPRVHESVEKAFKRSFPTLRLVPLTPYHRALSLLTDGEQSRFTPLNRAGSESLVDVIRSNRWIGEEFLLWLFHRTADGAQSYRILSDGPQDTDTPFGAWIGERLVLASSGDDGPQKVTISGLETRFEEPLTSLRRGKELHESTIFFELADTWRVTLKGELFHFASLKSPPVVVDRSEAVDELDERESAVYERIALVETFFQMFDSLLLSFLRDRISPDWGDRLRAMRRWIDGNAPPAD